MSWRAECVRLGLRWLIKSTSRPGVTIARLRQKVGDLQRWVPAPPKEAKIVRGTLGGVPVLHVAMPQSRPDRHILFLHGGGYVAGSPDVYMHLLWRIAAAAEAQIVAARYRLAPEHPFPAALDDAIAAWRGLLETGAEPGRSAVMGDSAGGGLALALALRARDEGVCLPAAIVVMSPWTDLAITGASIRRNARADPMLDADAVPRIASCYLAGADPRHPYASPLYGDLSGLPPVLVQVGSDEILFDDSMRMAARLCDAGVAARLEIWPRMPHVFQSFCPILPEARRALRRIGAFVREHVSAGATARGIDPVPVRSCRRPNGDAL